MVACCRQKLNPASIAHDPIATSVIATIIRAEIDRSIEIPFSLGIAVAAGPRRRNFINE
jgi:hypothetical protein